jgi:hypothetical protein
VLRHADQRDAFVLLPLTSNGASPCSAPIVDPRSRRRCRVDVSALTPVIGQGVTCSGRYATRRDGLEPREVSLGRVADRRDRG